MKKGSFNVRLAYVADGSPTIKQHWFIVLCLLGFTHLNNINSFTYLTTYLPVLASSLTTAVVFLIAPSIQRNTFLCNNSFHENSSTNTTYLYTIHKQTHARPTRYANPVMFSCWANVVDGGPTSKQH